MEWCSLCSLRGKAVRVIYIAPGIEGNATVFMQFMSDHFSGVRPATKAYPSS